MENNTVTIPYTVFVQLVCASHDLETITALVESEDEYCSKGIKVILGIKEKTNV